MYYNLQNNKLKNQYISIIILPKIDPVGIEGMKGMIRTYLANVDVDNVSRREHNKVLYELACLFRSARSITHKKILVR